MNVVETALYTAITGETNVTDLLASTASVYNQLAPRGANLPYVVFALLSGDDENDTPTRGRDMVYSVKGVSGSGFLEAGNIETQLDALLHNSELTISGYTNYWLARENDVRFLETTPEGDNFYHAGGIFRLRISK